MATEEPVLRCVCCVLRLNCLCGPTAHRQQQPNNNQLANFPAKQCAQLPAMHNTQHNNALLCTCTTPFALHSSCISDLSASCIVHRASRVARRACGVWRVVVAVAVAGARAVRLAEWVPPVGGAPSRHTSTCELGGACSTGVHRRGVCL
jgi:hypothetical protein